MNEAVMTFDVTDPMTDGPVASAGGVAQWKR